MYVKVNNQTVEKFPYTIGDLRKDYSNIGFPRVISDETLRNYGVFAVIETEQPSCNEATQYVRQADPEYIGGNWTQKWQIVERTPDEVIAYRAFKDGKIRTQRDNLLKGSDYTQLADAPVNHEEWATYRQALRDLPSDPGWPFVEFPTPPNS